MRADGSLDFIFYKLLVYLDKLCLGLWFWCDMAYVSLTFLQSSLLAAIASQMSSAWQFGRHSFTQMSSPSAGSVRAGSSAPWLPRPLRRLGLIQRASSPPSVSANFPGVRWKRELPRCGWACTTSPWSSRSPVRLEVPKIDYKNSCLNIFYMCE